MYRRKIFLLFCIVFYLQYSFTQKIKVREIERVKKSGYKITGQCRIIIDKSDYLLRVYDDKALIARYPVVFGKDVDKDKYKQGDKRTPEGLFKISHVAKHKKWHLMLMLNYPTEACVKKFEQRKKDGKIELQADIGNAIGIHGTWPGEDYVIDKYYNWTDGCISLKTAHLDDLKQYAKEGTSVKIEK